MFKKASETMEPAIKIAWMTKWRGHGTNSLMLLEANVNLNFAFFTYLSFTVSYVCIKSLVLLLFMTYE